MLINKVTTYFKGYLEQVIDFLFSCKKLKQEFVFLGFGVLSAAFMLVFLFACLHLCVSKMKVQTESLQIMMSDLQSLEDMLPSNFSSDGDNFSLEDLKVEFDVIKIEKGKLGTKEYLKLRKSIEMSFEVLSTMLASITKSDVFSIKDFSMKRSKNNKFEINFILVKNIVR